MPDTLRESRAIPAERDDRNLHICKLRACCKRDDATMESVEAVALDLVRAVAVTTDVIAKANLPRMQTQFYQRILHGRPDAIVAAAITPDAFGFRIVLGKSGQAGLQSDIHDRAPAYSKPGNFFSFSEVPAHLSISDESSSSWKNGRPSYLRILSGISRPHSILMSMPNCP